MNTTKQNPHQEITNHIIAALETAEANEWKCPWHRPALGWPVNALTEAKYRGSNTLSLWLMAHIHGYSSNKWGTYRQWQKLDSHVKRGEKAARIILYKQIEKETDDGDKQTSRIYQTHCVFNANQIVGWTDCENTDASAEQDSIIPVEAAEQFIKAVDANTKIGGITASYNCKTDKITMPDQSKFVGSDTSETWYATLLHELVHWTGHKTRLNRFGESTANTKDYAFEELIAEFGSAFLCKELGITNSIRADHVHYLKHWLQLLKEDDRAVFRASAKASTAVEFLHKKTRYATQHQS